MKEDLLKIIGILVIIGFLIYLASKALKLHLNLQTGIMEGLVNPTSNGVAGSASVYANSIADQGTIIEDSLLMTKYKTEYENVIINLDEYIGLLMLQSALHFSVADGASQENIALLASLNTMNNAKQSLNTVMTFLDQK